MIPVDSIVIPARFVAACNGWHSSCSDKLYAVSSTGGLTLGDLRPLGCDSDEKWYYSIWCDLSADVGCAASAAGAGHNFRAGDDPGDGYGHDEDYPILVDFEAWIEVQVDALAECYDFRGWGGE